MKTVLEHIDSNLQCEKPEIILANGNRKSLEAFREEITARVKTAKPSTRNTILNQLRKVPQLFDHIRKQKN